MRINQNISAMNTHASMVRADSSISKSLERLSSGLRINRAADDAAGLAISEKMRGQIRGLQQASRNAQDGISLLQTAEGALNETHSILQRMRELAVQSANDTLTNSDRGEIQKEVDQLTKEIDRIAGSTNFNTKNLLRGTAAASPRVNTSGSTLAGGALGVAASGTLTLASQVQAGDTATVNGTTYTFAAVADATTHKVAIGSDANGSASNLATAIAGDSAVTASATNNVITVTAAATGTGGNNITLGSTSTPDQLSLTMHIGANAGQSVTVTLGIMDSASLGVGRNADGSMTGAGADAYQGLDVSTQTASNSAITTIDAALSSVSSERSKLGAYQNRLEHTISNLGAAAENLSSSESRIRDVDMAEEMANFSKSQILMQASTAMMAQANQKPQAVLKLLG